MKIKGIKRQTIRRYPLQSYWPKALLVLNGFFQKNKTDWDSIWPIQSYDDGYDYCGSREPPASQSADSGVNDVQKIWSHVQTYTWKELGIIMFCFWFFVDLVLSWSILFRYCKAYATIFSAFPFNSLFHHFRLRP